MLRQIIKMYKIAYTKESPQDFRTPYQRFMDWLQTQTTITKMDKMAFAFLIKYAPMYISAIITATLLGLMFNFIGNKYGLQKLIISVTIFLYISIKWMLKEIQNQLQSIQARPIKCNCGGKKKCKKKGI